MQLYTYKISELDWKPVDFKVIGGDFQLKKEPFSFKNGMFFNMYYMLSGVKDINFNSRTGIILSDLNRNVDIVEDKNKPNKNKKLTSIKSIVTDGLASVFKHYPIYNTLSGLELVRSNFLQEDELTFYFEDSYVYVEDYFGKYLTNGGFGESQLYFGSKSNPLNENQKWDYILNDGSIILFSYNTDFKYVVTRNSRERLILADYQSSGTDRLIPPINSYLYMASYRDYNRVTEINNFKTVYNSLPIKYNVDPDLNNKQDLIYKPDYLTDNDYFQNYLGIFPYENLNSDGTHDFYFHGLKNYQTYDYKYTKDGSHQNRKYQRIFSGTNQNKGTEKIYLNYITDKISLEFPTDELTDFYFTPTVDELQLQFASFWENGASAGQFPYTSDRIYTKRDSNFADLPQLENIYKPPFDTNVKFLCSWLRDEGVDSEGNKKPAIWYDRYYNSAKYTQNAALTSTFMLYQDEIYPSKNLVFDVQSKLVFTPGTLYRYYHAGNKTALEFIKDLNYTFDIDKNEVKHANVLNVTSWNDTRLTDHSYYNNYGLTFGNSGNFFGDYWSLDGSNYAIFQATPSLLPPENLTVSFWLNFDDWKNVKANQIFGNYYESGFGLFNVSKPISPLFSVIDNKSNTIYNFNINFNEASKTKTDIIAGDIVQRMPDFSYWVFDSKNCIAIKYDINNSVISRDPQSGKTGPVKLPLTEITQVETDSNENLFIFDNIEKKYIIIDKFGNGGTTSFPTTQLCNRIEVDLNNRVLDGFGDRVVVGNCSVIDNNNQLWQIIGPNLYKEKNLIGTVGASNEMTCDAYNNIWIVGEDDSYTKIDNNGNFVFRYSFKKTPLLNITNCPPSPPPEPPIIPVLEEELPFLSTNDLRYIITLPDFYTILVTPPLPKPKQPVEVVKKRKRAINFINGPDVFSLTENNTTLCGLSSIQINDKMIMVDLYDNQAYLINQLGQLELKLNFEILNQKEYTKVDFRTSGDFTGYQHNRKFKSNAQIKQELQTQLGIDTSNVTSVFSWKWQSGFFQGTNLLQSDANELLFDVSNLAAGWHHFCFTIALNQPRVINEIAVYIDSKKVTSRRAVPPNTTIPSGVLQQIHYPFRTSLNIGSTTVKNTLLNNFLNIQEGYKMIGKFGDLKMYDYAITEKDVKQLYLSSNLAPKVPSLSWEMEIGDRNYVEEIENWFKFQLPTHKTKYYNLNIHNLNIEEKLKTPIENALKNIIQKYSPAHTTLNKINWMIPSKNKRRIPELGSSVSATTEICPNRLTVIQICNSNALIDDNFAVILNGAYIGDVILDRNELIGSYFIGSDGTNIDYILENPDFICPINQMRKFTFPEAIISKTTTNELQLINIQPNNNGNFGTIQIRSYLKSIGDKLINPAIITDLNYSGDTGESFSFNFNYICP